MIPGSVFARYAHPPNVLGYCGPSDPNELITATSSERGSQGFAAVARRFAGVWPYLELIAVSNGISDPLEDRVVEAYWIGSTLLEGVPVSSLLDCVRANPDGRMPSRLGRSDLEGAVLAGGIANHNFHVFAVYPWLALARSGRLDPAMSVLERCCIRSGRVTRVDAGNVEVWTRPVALDGTDLCSNSEVPYRSARSCSPRSCPDHRLSAASATTCATAGSSVSGAGDAGAARPGRCHPGLVRFVLVRPLRLPLLGGHRRRGPGQGRRLAARRPGRRTAPREDPSGSDLAVET